MEIKDKFTDLQVQVLNELGIDLWVSRPGVAHNSPASELNLSATAELVPEVILRVPDTEAAINAVASKNAVAKIEDLPQSVTFDLVCMRNSQLLLVAQTKGESDEGLLGSLIRVSDRRNKGEKFVFNWPQLDSHAGIDAARKAFLAFTTVQASKLETPVLVIFGSTVTSLLSADFPKSGEGKSQELSTFEWNGFSCIAVHDIESLRLRWQLKRDLCLQLVKLRPAIFRLHPTNALLNPA